MNLLRELTNNKTMINFFRKIRKQLANENQFSKYSRYAFGEIVLVVLGILIALQLNNWNENRMQEAQFKITLEQLYNTIKFDSETYKGQMIMFQEQARDIDFLLNYPDSIPTKWLPYALYIIMQEQPLYKSESLYHVQNLNYNPKNLEQNAIAKEILNYINIISTDEYRKDAAVNLQVKNIDIPYPKVDIKKPNTGWSTSDSTYYNNTDIKNTYNLVKSHKFRATLKTLRTIKIYNSLDAANRYRDGLSIMNLIKDYYPMVKLLYRDVGLKGTAIDGFDNIGGKSTPMILTDVEKSIWEIDIYLLEGLIKFRCRDSWQQNWGATHQSNDVFPKGIGVQEGSDIIIHEAGNYHVIFNLTTNMYEFIKLEE